MIATQHAVRNIHTPRNTQPPPRTAVMIARSRRCHEVPLVDLNCWADKITDRPARGPDCVADRLVMSD